MKCSLVWLRIFRQSAFVRLALDSLSFSYILHLYFRRRLRLKFTSVLNIFDVSSSCWKNCVGRTLFGGTMLEQTCLETKIRPRSSSQFLQANRLRLLKFGNWQQRTPQSKNNYVSKSKFKRFWTYKKRLVPTVRRLLSSVFWPELSLSFFTGYDMYNEHIICNCFVDWHLKSEKRDARVVV